MKERRRSVERNTKILLFICLFLAVGFGFAPAAGFGADHHPFAVLHVFLFNLLSGGLLLILYVRGKKAVGAFEIVFMAGAGVFALGAFFKMPAVNVLTAVLLGAMVEGIRWRKFSWFPYEFFTAAPVSRKFEQAALLCLSLGLFIAAATVLNNEHLHLIHLEKLGLHVFFLGFSFPISLITYALIFERGENSGRPRRRAIEEFCFWGLNLGVIIFFVFIVLGIYPMQLVMALTLFVTVWLTLYVHVMSGRRGPEWSFLLSALGFLVVGSATGIIYILVSWKSTHYTPGYLLSLHSAANLFGWNLTWMMLTLRKNQFPLRAGLKLIIPLHWLFVLSIPLGRVVPAASLVSSALAAALLGLTILAPAPKQKPDFPPLPRHQENLP